MAVLTEGQVRRARRRNRHGVDSRVGLAAVRAVTAQTLDVVARSRPFPVPETSPAEVAVGRIEVTVRWRNAFRPGVHIDRVISGSGAGVTVLAEVSAAGQLDELPIAGLVRV